MNLAAFLDSPGGDFQPRPTDVPLPGPSEIIIRVSDASVFLQRMIASLSIST